MRAIDTNVVVRFLTADDAGQARAARAVIAAGYVFVPVTVVLEAEWVLRAGYGLPATKIASALGGLGGLDGVHFEDPVAVAQALDWLDRGIDFADALHLARSGHCTAFVSFDQKLAKRAKGLTPIPVAAP